MSGASVTGAEAELADSAGVVARLAPDGEHLGSAIALAAEIAANPQLAVREIVRVRRALAAERMTTVVSRTGAGQRIELIPPRT